MTVTCRVHGPMRYRTAPHWYECPGYDGEGCEVPVVYAEDAALALDAGAALPGVEVKAQ